MHIRPWQDDESEARACAEMMATTDPWLTLGRNFEECLAVLTDGMKEIHVAAGDDGEPLGFIVLNMRGAFVGYIQTICVSAAARGGGIGSQLIEFAEERIFREAPNVFLCVTDFNTRARQLYERLGYEKVGVLRDYIVQGHDEIFMRKALMPMKDFAQRAASSRTND
jgi:ribosomal protein S18 acetylase RimI-like enzyme